MVAQNRLNEEIRQDYYCGNSKVSKPPSGFCINLKLQNYKIISSGIGVSCTNQLVNLYFLSLHFIAFFFLLKVFFFLIQLRAHAVNALNFKELQVLNYLLKKLKCYEFIHPKIIMHIHESCLHNIWGEGQTQ